MNPFENLNNTDSDIEEEKQDRLVFPINMHESVTTGGIKKADKTHVIASFWIVGCIILGWFLAGWLRNVLPNHYIWIVVGVELALQLTVGVFILRMLLDEKTIISEMENVDNSFAKYFGIYREILSEDEGLYPFDVMEFSDGSHTVYIQFLLGYNTNQASEATYACNKTINNLINKSGMSYRTIYTTEDFGNSEAANNLRKIINNIEDPRLFKAYRDIVQGVLKTSAEESNLLCVTYIIHAKTTIQKEELPRLVNSILSTVSGAGTAYREVYTLNYTDIVEFYRNYYKLDVLDMGAIRVHTVTKKSITCSLKLLRVYGSTGKVYDTQDMVNLREELLSEYGLKQVNKGV